MNKTTMDYADYAEYDRRQRGIERHLLAAFLGGLVVGLVGMLTAGKGPEWLGQLYDPYVYLALSLTVGATASGFGWALLTTFLAAVTTLVAAMGASAVRGDVGFDIIGGSAAGLNWTLVLLVGLGLLGYVTRRNDRWGDLAAGAVGAMLLADVLDRATPGSINTEPAFWPVPAIVVGGLSVALVVALRRNLAGRVCAVALTALFAGLFAMGMTGVSAGWIPLAAQAAAAIPLP
ncbi:hypothetical protein HII36_23580 [Nonomuraea sp. NN258]|uniref:hypothetical protein n=1 Tax=Nonomuraea antri TaxID=2730852 RepID=UPI001569D593|nr:hypothetical protein [Nonomuraea antri]NRQ34792.1 hypothetical protein [Nonomuraea antri]